jgi:hypothetical protein
MNYNKGKKKSSKPLNDKHLLHVTKTVGVDLGSEVDVIEYNLEACRQFDDHRVDKKAIISQGDNASEIVGSVLGGGGDDERVNGYNDQGKPQDEAQEVKPKWGKHPRESVKK